MCLIEELPLERRWELPLEERCLVALVVYLEENARSERARFLVDYLWEFHQLELPLVRRREADRLNPKLGLLQRVDDQEGQQ